MKKTVFLLLLAAMFAPWATQAQNYLLFQDFESTSLPADWTNEYGWSCTSRGTHGYGDYHVQNATGTSDNNKLISPVIDLSSVSFAKLSFMHCQLNSYGNHDQLKVFYRASPNDDWTLLVHYTGLIASWTEEVIELPNISSTYQIAFGMVYNYGPGVALDYVRVEEITCPRPVSLGVAGTTATTATLSWTERGNATAWQICLNDDENNLIDANTNPYTLTNLSTEIPYTAKVRAVCGTDEQSEWSEPISFEPTDKLVIGSGTATSGSLPTAFQWYYSMSEQIYTTAELGDEGTVLSIDFYCENNASYECTRTFDIYMVNTTRTRFDDDNDWVTVSSDDLVYRGYVSFPVGSAWKTITLDTPFEYDGTSNMLIAVRDYTWGYTNGVSCRTFEASSDDNQSRYVYDNYSSYDPTSPPTNGAGSRSRYKNQIRLLKVTCMPPAGLVASNVTDETATLSWTERGDATNWVVEYADNSDFIGATSETVSGNPTITLTTGLVEETQYYARVKAVCSSDDESYWSNPISFTTDFCSLANKCEIFYELHAETGMIDVPNAWNGAAIRVIDYTDPDNEILLAKLTIEEDYSYYDDYESDDSDTPLYTDYPEETDHYSYTRGTLPLCGGRDVRFEWEYSDYGYDYLYSFVVYDADYDTLFFGTGNGNGEIGGGDEPTKDGGDYRMLYEYENIDCRLTSCPRPTNVTITYEGGTTATVTWDNVGSDYDVFVDYIDDENQAVHDVYQLTTNSYTLTGLSLATTYTVQVQTICDRTDLTAPTATSHISRPVSFTTDMCMPEEMCSISYELHDYGSDGWNGAAINVVDASSGIVLDTWTIGNSGTGFEPLEKMTSGSIEETDGYSYANGTLRVCDGLDIQFVWVSGGYDDDCSYTIYDAEDNVILSSDSENNGDENVKDGEDDENDEDDEETDVLYTYTVDCPPCPKPYDLAVDYEGGTTATVTWTGFANSFDISVNDIVTEDVTSPHMLNLELATTYEVKVRADCGSEDGQSVWSRIVSFTTDLCEDVCDIQYELTDAFGDGWNGNGIQIVDVTTEYIYTTLTIENGETASGTLRVCNGSEIEFRWVEGSWPEECSYIVYGVNEEMIFSGSNVMGDDVAYMVNCGAGVIDANGWYAISAPYYDGDGSGSSITVANIEGLVPTETGVAYDLFRYNESLAKWENQKGSTETGHLAAGFTTLDCGRGYIYRSSASTIFTFNGNPYEGPLEQVQTLTTSCTTDENLKGFNLIGNPYQQPIYKGVNFDYGISPSLVPGFYSLRSDGSWFAHTDDDAIAIGEGVLVKVSGNIPVQLSFDDESEEVGEGPIDDYKKGSAEMSLQFDVNGCGHEDVVYAMLNAQHSEGLPKVAHLNADLPSLSIPQGGTDYAIAMIDGSTQSFPLKFRAVGNGEYTVSVSGDVSEMGYLHLIDRATGSDIDLLSQPTYTFTNTLNQSSTQRFVVKLSPNADEEGDGIFAYQKGDRIVVDGTGTLQVYDVLGRQLFTHEINSQCSILNSQFPNTGVYILRLNGKSQKLVIK